MPIYHFHPLFIFIIKDVISLTCYILIASCIGSGEFWCGNLKMNNSTVLLCLQHAILYFGVLYNFNYDQIFYLNNLIFFLIGQESTYLCLVVLMLHWPNFCIIVIADDFDRSINEAIKITKYGIHLFIIHPVPIFVCSWCVCVSVCLFKKEKWPRPIILISLYCVLTAYVLISSSDRNNHPQNLIIGEKQDQNLKLQLMVIGVVLHMPLNIWILVRYLQNHLTLMILRKIIKLMHWIEGV